MNVVVANDHYNGHAWKIRFNMLCYKFDRMLDAWFRCQPPEVISKISGIVHDIDVLRKQFEN